MAHPSHVYAGPSCPHCRATLPAPQRAGVIRCAECFRDFEAAVFTPPTADVRVREMSEAGPDGATPCANHPGNAASSECARCGVFMCTLCRIDADGQALCPTCYERLSTEGALASARTSFRDHASLATKLSLLSLVFFIASPVFGAPALFCAYRGRKQKMEWGDEDGYARLWIAVFLSLAGMAACIAFYVSVLGTG